MPDEYYEWGEPIDVGELRNGRAIEFAGSVKACAHAEFLQTVRKDALEGVVCGLRPEIPQHPVADIRKSERMCVLFPPNASAGPQVRALRMSFPDALLHLNESPADEPRSLCLFAEDFRQIARTLTGPLLLRRILGWLGRAAAGQSHTPDQPLEPFVLAPTQVIFNPRDLTGDVPDRVLVLQALPEEPHRLYHAALISIAEWTEKMSKTPGYLLMPIDAKQWHSHLINRSPRSLLDLAKTLERAGVDLVATLQAKVIQTFHRLRRPALEHFCAILVRIPKTREAGGQTEVVEELIFFLNDSLASLGEKLGVFAKPGGVWGECLQYTPANLDSVKVDSARPIRTFDRTIANKLAGVTEGADLELTAVGAGAIGSQIVMNLARQGIGKWFVIDEDHLLPHNQSRHALGPVYEGVRKAAALAHEIEQLLHDDTAAASVCDDVSRIVTGTAEAKQCFEDAKHIFDFSVSPAVSRHLSVVKRNAPVTSAFMLQNGRTLVIISEGTDRLVRLDDLEIQLAAHCIENSSLSGIFASTGEPALRYSSGCRDVTTVLPQDVVAVQAGIASQFLKGNMQNKNPTICVWRLDSKSLSIATIPVQSYRISTARVGPWEFRISEHALDLLRQNRERKLPNETGGVMLGSFDVLSKTVYVGMVLPSPADSAEWPTVYIRGVKGLRKTVEAIREATGGNLTYVGEWHSHPARCAAKPSGLDIKAHEWLVDTMGEDGYPGVMLIQARGRSACVLLRCGGQGSAEVSALPDVM